MHPLLGSNFGLYFVHFGSLAQCASDTTNTVTGVDTPVFLLLFTQVGGYDCLVIQLLP